MTEQSNADRQALAAASAAIDRACAELDRRDPEGAASFRAQQEQIAEGLRQLRETYGVVVPEAVTVTWTRHLPAEARAEMDAEMAGLSGEQRDVALAAWKATAEVYADPELLAALTTDHGDDDPMPPETAAGLARLRDRPNVFAAPPPAGYTIGVYLPPEASETVRDALFDQIADATSVAEEGQRWDAHVVGLPGDPLGVVDGTVRP